MDDQLSAAAVADTFWELFGSGPQYPCDLEEELLWLQPEDFCLNFDAVPDLDLAAVDRRARQLGLPYRSDEPNRPLRGCLLASAGRAYILYEAGDAADEQRFTKAHEVAHFLVDYYIPRRRAIRLLGPDILPVLNGARQLNQAERLHAAMLQIHFGLLANLMERSARRGVGASVVLIEDRADRIALELLAPARLVARRLALAPAQISGAGRLQWLTELLTSDFGLPEGLAAEYARTIIHARGGSALVDQLKRWLPPGLTTF